MGKAFVVRWEGQLPGTPEQVWDGITRQASGWLWPIEYEPRVGGAERGLSGPGGTVTAWDPPRHFGTRAEDEHGVNQLDQHLEPQGEGTYLRYVHHGAVAEEEYDVQLAACEAHTVLYLHSLGEYVAHFAGRSAAYVSVMAPDASADGGLAVVRRALGVPDDVAVGDTVALAGPTPVEGVVDHVSEAFLGVRSAQGLHRVYGRSVWGWPVEVAHHLFDPGVDAEAVGRAWQAWIDGVFATEAVA